jgi:drug/metabolite transporter (DMT)-like permease
MGYVFSVQIGIVGLVIYHVAMKSLPADLNPFLSLTLVYLVAACFCLVGYGLGPSSATHLREYANVHILGLALGLCAVEFGFLWAYRTGWHMGVVSMFISVSASLILLPLGVIYFQDKVTPGKLGGVFLCAAGLYMLTKK